jgi:hypothetical protein
LYDFKKAETAKLEQAMDDNLVGYLLNALAPDEERQVEAHLREHPEAEQKLELLRQALQPLILDSNHSEPPLGLAQRTLAFVKANGNHQAPRPPVLSRPASVFPRVLWQRMDVLVAACLLILVGGIGMTWLSHVWYLEGRVACGDNLRGIYAGLRDYQDTYGELPNVHTVAKPPRDVAGMVLLKLLAVGALPKGFSLQCAGRKGFKPPLSFDDALALSDDDFTRQAANLNPSYGFSLGYRDEKGAIHGPQFNPESDTTSVVLVADAPPLNPLHGNSPNHGGKGQNVLFLNGHFKFCPDRVKSFKGDDLYLNKKNKVGAGLDSEDNVVGQSQARP